MADSFVESRAKILVQLDINTRNNAQFVIDRYSKLLADPDLRDEGIFNYELNYIEERAAEELSPEAAAVQKEKLIDYAESTWDEINDVPLADRGANYILARAMVDELCSRQAYFEVLAAETLAISEQLAAVNKAAAARIPDARKRTMAREGGIKESIGRLSAAKAEPEGETDGKSEL